MEYAANLRLTLHERRCHPQPVTEGISFLGFRVFPDYRRIKRRKSIAYRRHLKDLLADYEAGVIPFADIRVSVQSWVNHARYGQTYRLRQAMFRTLPVPRPLK